MPGRIHVYDSQSSAYHRAFEVFLAHTDQKTKARARLDELVAGLPRREVFLDVGAGNGQVTSWFMEAFARTIAIEPNDSLREELRHHCPGAEVDGCPILDANPPARGDFILCSHVFYYIDSRDWRASLERIVSWLAGGGMLVLVLQNSGTDCMRMLDHFLGQRFDIARLATEFRERSPAHQVTLETVPARVAAPDLETACTVAEFMLNLLPLPDPPTRDALERYVDENFRRDDGYEFSCDQDFVCIRA